MKNKITKKQITIVMFSAIFIFMFVLNFLTPLIADDFSYSFGADGRIKNLYDIYNKQVDHYFTWGGRTVAHTIAQIFLLFPKIIFSIANTFAYVLLIYLIYRIARGKSEDKPILVIAINLLLWFVLPVFGQTCLWLIGSCNYLWTTDIILIFMLKYMENKPTKRKILSMILMFLLGIIAGWTNENTAVGAIFIVVASLFFMKKSKVKLEKWHISGAVGIVIGFILLIAAPGNYARNELFVDNTSVIVKWIYRAVNYSISFVDILKPLILFTIILVTINIYYKKEIEKNVIVYLIAAVLTVYSMVLSPTFPERAWFGVIIYAIIADMYLLYDVDKLNKVYTYIIADVVLVFLTLYCSQYLNTALGIKELKSTWNSRINYIESEKANNNFNVKVERYVTLDKHNPNYKLEDIAADEGTWPNNDISKYFGIQGISSK